MNHKQTEIVLLPSRKVLLIFCLWRGLKIVHVFSLFG